VRAYAVAALLVLAAPTHDVGAAPVPRPTDDLRRLDYLFGIALECVLVDTAVIEGYTARTAAIVARLGLSDAARRHTRAAALIAVDREWANRGLGGYRGWCRTEGADAAALFTGVPTP